MALGAYVMILAFAFSSTGLAYAQEQYSMNTQPIPKLKRGHNSSYPLVAHVGDQPDDTQDVQDTGKDENSTPAALDPYDPASHQMLAALKERARLFELKSKLGHLCAKGLQLAEQVLSAPTPIPEDEELVEWEREMRLLVHTWLTEEQQAEWRSAGKEIVAYVDAHAERLSKTPNDQTKLELGNRLFALLITAQVESLEKFSNDLGVRMNAIRAARTLD